MSTIFQTYTEQRFAPWCSSYLRTNARLLTLSLVKIHEENFHCIFFACEWFLAFNNISNKMRWWFNAQISLYKSCKIRTSASNSIFNKPYTIKSINHLQTTRCINADICHHDLFIYTSQGKKNQHILKCTRISDTDFSLITLNIFKMNTHTKTVYTRKKIQL